MLWTHDFAPLARIALLIAAVVGTPSFAQEPAAASDPPSEIDAAFEAARPVAKSGPHSVTLRDQGVLQLPEGYVFIPVPEAARIMNAMGNQSDSRFIGLIMPESDASWFVTVDFEDSGYIEDGDAKEWDADELLDSLKEGTEEANKHRAQLGVAPIQVTRWIERPAYDSGTHRLVWSAEAKLKQGEDPDPTINYNTYVLGREGYISLNLITTASTIDADKQVARNLLAATDFNQGKRYTDFNESTDKTAAYGLTALVGGIAAKKLGLLAVVGVFLAKFAKVILIGIAAGGGVVAKFFKKKSDDSSNA